MWCLSGTMGGISLLLIGGGAAAVTGSGMAAAAWLSLASSESGLLSLKLKNI
jgi:hypothetical protein